MGKIVDRLLAMLLTMILIVSTALANNSLLVRAEEPEKVSVSFTLKISVAEGTDAPAHYGVSYEVVDSEGRQITDQDKPEGYAGSLEGASNGSQVSQTMTFDANSAMKVKIWVTSAGKDIFYGGSNSDTSAWSEGKIFEISEVQGQTYEFQLQNSRPSGGDGDNGGGNPGGDNNGGNNQNEVDVNITVNWSGDFGDIAVGDRGIQNIQGNQSGSANFTRVSKNGNEKITIRIQANPTEVYSSIKVNDEEKIPSGESREQLSFEIDVPSDAISLSIVAVKGASTKGTIVWNYDDSQGADAMVEHGTVEMVTTGLDGNGGYWTVDYDAPITVKLIPDYGYQVVGAKINGDVDLTANSSQNEFTFNMPHTNVHFQGIFTKTDDIVSVNSSAVSEAALSNGSAVANTGGTAKMTVSSATPANDVSEFELSVDEGKTIQAVNISMEQVFYKNSADSVWSNTKTDLSAAAEVQLKVSQAANGYAVLREHNGQVEKINSSYNVSTGSVTFSSDKFSVFTLVPLTEGDNNYNPPTPAPEEPSQSNDENNQSSSVMQDSNTEGTDIEVVEQEEVKRELSTLMMSTSTSVSTQTNLVSEQLPADTFDLSSFSTSKGFISGIEKIAAATLEKAIQQEVVLSENTTIATTEPVRAKATFYTEQPICFTRDILKSMVNSKVDFEYFFNYKGKLYSITILTDTELMDILKDNPFAGPLYIGYVLKTTKLVE